LLEWTIAVGCVLVVAGVGSKALQELRGVQAVTPVIADERAIPDPPASMFSGAVLVPMLLLSTGDELRVGQRASVLASRINQAWQIGAEAIERSAIGYRIVRRYDDGATQFAVVLETDGDDDRVVAIYRR
jgi:hypothetical protein